MRPIDADALLEKMQRTSRYFSVVYDVDAMPAGCGASSAWEVDESQKVKRRMGVLRLRHYCRRFFGGVFPILLLLWHEDGRMGQR